MQEALAEAATPQTPRWVSLVDQITQILKERGHPHPDAWKSFPLTLHPHAYTKDDKIQRFLINRQWQIILGSADVDTSNERYCLLDDGSIDDWLNSFRNGVAPCVIAHNLPPVTQ